MQNVAKCKADWTPAHFVDETVSALKEKLGDDKVLMGLSGGVDSTIAATLIHKAIGDNLYCIFLDNGLLRKDEFEEVLDSYKHMGLEYQRSESRERILCLSWKV